MRDVNLENDQGNVNKADPLVHVIDDQADVRTSLAWLIESVQLKVSTYPAIANFLDLYREGGCGCLVLDVRMPGISGIDFLERMPALGLELPVILLSGHGTIPMATRALRAGAVDFIQKPVNEQLLLDRIQEAIERSRHHLYRKSIGARMADLTTRELDVVARIAAGMRNKEIARVLELSSRTVESHRAEAMRKLAVGTVAELVKLVLLQQGDGTPYP